MGEKSSQTQSKSNNITITEHQLGAWKFKLADSSSFDPVNSWNEFVSAFPLLRRLVLDIWDVAPGLFTLYVVCQIWEGIEGSIMMHLSNRLLQMIENGLITGNFDSWNIYTAIITRLFCTVFVTYLNAYGERILDLLDGSVTRHFQLKIIQAELRMDLTTTQKTGGLPGASANEAWKALETILSFVKFAFMGMSQLLLIIHLSRSSGGWFYGLLCLSRPVCGMLFSKSFFHYVTFAFVNNIDHRRMTALNKFSSGEYKQDIIGGNMGQWIISEMKKTHKRLGLVSSRHPAMLYESSSTMTLSQACMSVLGDLPMVYCAINALRSPGTTSIASLAILQQSTLSLRTTGALFTFAANGARGSIASLKAVYTATELAPTGMTDGNIPYPPMSESKFDSSMGMALELRNVSFSYPGEQTASPALRDISLAINPGHLVVIVGSNGSGKSTLIRILSRLYEPTSGSLLIDGLPATKYRIEDLHEATALLSQDSKLYPFTIAENIGLGFPECIEDEEMILDACRKGGSLKTIQNLKDGLQTTLDPCIDTFQFNLLDKPDHPLYQEMENTKKKIEVSGGEKQKIVASRAFMRFNSGKVKFVAVDEPSSALDAEAELELFNNLRAERPGKTMIVVTHRFGHLTRLADQIICMKDGQIVECGTHVQLMEQKAEYANLYTIQAEAFS